jgi:hypothetical protein
LAWQYYEKHPGELTEDAIKSLAGYLPQSQLQGLRGKLAPPKPGELPPESEAVLAWFKNQYMPYRQWAIATGDQAASQRLEELGRKFGTWYLDYYPRAIASGDPRIVFQRSAEMHAVAEGEVTLIVILDGLHLNDASDFVRRLTQAQPRLMVTRDVLAFSAIPTITEVCQPAVVYGCAPRDVARYSAQQTLTVLGEGQSSLLQSAQARALFVWTIGDPDRTYHRKGEPEIIRRQVDAALDSWAKTVGEACAKVPQHLRLTIVVTTDHGRLIGVSRRSEKAPEGMVVHQRAARGAYSEAFSKAWSFLDADSRIAVLHGPRFGISDVEHAAVVLSDSSFYMSDGRTGEEFCPHGGVFPEEVILPWVVLRRDAEPPSVVCRATGRAKEGGPGKIRLEFHNSGFIGLGIQYAEVKFGDATQRVGLDGVVAPLSQHEAEIDVPEWPRKHAARGAKIVVFLKLPAGDLMSIGAETALDSDGFYVQDDDILGDLK